MILVSAILVLWESVDRLFNPRELGYLGVLFAAGIVGFAGNELVAVYRIRVGRQIGSMALVADGRHARADGSPRWRWRPARSAYGSASTAPTRSPESSSGS